ncbi:MAG: hypothetical protein R6X16_10925 [Anaerolineae bacterium]
MKAAVIERPYAIALRDVPMPVVTADDEVQIRVVVTGICGSEIHAFHGRTPFGFPR